MKWEKGGWIASLENVDADVLRKWRCSCLADVFAVWVHMEA